MGNRLSKTKETLEKEQLDAVLVSSTPNIIYLTGFSNFSKFEREAYLLILAQPQGLEHKTPGVLGYIITDGRYSEAVRMHIPHFTLIERSIENPLEKIFQDLKLKHKIKRLGIEEDNLTVYEYKLFKKHFNNMNHYSTSQSRARKDPKEITAIEHACKLGDETFSYILRKIKLGVAEKELAFEIEHFIKKAGAEVSFPPIVAFGKNSSVPHHQTSNQRLASRGQFVLLDFGAKVDNYCSDITRTVFFGKPNGKQKLMYQTVMEAQARAIDFLNSSFIIYHSKEQTVKASNVDKVARSYITKQGFPTIPHSLGHGIGLEVHESPCLSPNSKDKLSPGMVFSIEPGIYIPNFGGVRIEDLVVLETSGPRLLTKSPRDLTLVG